ncbi:MAG: putative membrane-bound dehydrogenase-like protein [Verrucomicrobiales bacterium]|jgi:putative membrane-bound dehydrogenase-like protein
MIVCPKPLTTMRSFVFLFISLYLSSSILARPESGPVRILFLGHDAQHHPSNEYYPMLAEALGRDAIYFDYHTSVEEALGDYDYLSQFDGLLLYANHDTIEEHQYQNLIRFVEEGGGFVPVHCASFCFRNKMGFVRLVGGQFNRHRTGEFTAKIVEKEHPAMQGVSEFETWDETYVHSEHGTDRTILMVREPRGADDNITKPEPWTWTRSQGKGRVYYTASGHDQRVWGQPSFHQLLKSGILWAIGEERRATYDAFVSKRVPLRYEKRDNIPNYERRPEPLPYQLPLSPEESMEFTQVPVGWRLELFAAEPDVINPMQLAWDERGRLWVIETTDYPNEVREDREGNDKIKILEDTDGDGRCDKVTVFADGFNIPTSLVFANGGVIVHQAPVTLFLKDTDGDDKADTRGVLLNGWGPGDTHAGPSNLRYGLDNQIWGTVGYAAFNGTVGGEEKRFGMGVYRFAKDASSLEFLHQFNNNTWGLGFNEAGDVFGSTANNNPSFFCGIPATAFAPGERGMSAKMVASSPKFHPITPNIRQVDAFGAYTAGAGHAFANSDAFPETWRGKRAFVAGPTGNLLGQYQASNDGAGFVTKNAYSLVASADEWFSPVAADVGPDGHLWIADWYNFIIQHNPTPSENRGGYRAENGKGNAHVNPNRDREHGRIYRLVWEKAPQSRIHALANASQEQLVQALSDPNQFWRVTAQRLIVDGEKEDAVPALRTSIGIGGVGAVHALWALHGLGQLDDVTHRAALLSSDPVLRRNAVKALPAGKSGVSLLFESSVINDPDLTTRLAAFVALAEFPSSAPLKSAITNLLNNAENQSDEWLSAALNATAVRHGVEAIDSSNLEPGPNLLETAEWSPRSYSGGEGIEHSKPADEGVEGSDCLKITATQAADTSFHTYVTVKPNTHYRMSAKIRTADVKGRAMGALLNVHELQGGTERIATKPLKGNNDWVEVSKDFQTESQSRISINCLLGGWGRSTGIAWFDDIRLNELVPIAKTAAKSKLEEGSIDSGKTIFFTHQVAACNRCHQLGGEGGVIGPALDGIATRKGADYIRQSLVDPNAALADGYNGPVSPMPPINLLLGEQELADVLAYLATLKE